MPIDRDKVQKQAEKLVASGKVEAGIQQYNLLVQDNPRDLGTLNKIGDLYVRLGKKGEAIKSYGRIAEIYAGDGFFLKAIAIYKKITKIDPAHLETLHSLADLYSKQGLKTEARAQYLVVAEALLKAGQAQKAIAAYEALASLDPDNAAHRLHVAELKLKCGLMAEAAQAFLDLARELESRGNARESAQVYERALKAGRGDARVAEGLCAALRRSGQHAKAVQIADEILASNPGNAPLLQSKGESLEALGRAEEAEACLRESLRRDPKRPETMLALARVLAGRGATAEAHPVVSGGLDPIMGAGKGAEAAKVLEAILARDPENRAVLEDLYRVHTMLGSKGGMIAAGEKLAEVSAREGRLHEALAVARRLAEIDPMATRHRQRLERLKALEEGGARPGAAPPSAAAPAAGELEEAAMEIRAAGETGAAPPAEEEPPVVDVAPSEAEGITAGALAREVAAAGGFVEPELSPEDDDFISEHLTEAEVFVKYGLADRAAEQLAAVLERFPWHVAARRKLRDVHLEEGNRARAATEAAQLARVFFERGDLSAAAAAAAEARSIDAACPVLPEVEALLGGTAAPPAPPPALEAEDEPSMVVIEEDVPVEESMAVPAVAPGPRPAEPPPEDLEEFDFYLSQGMSMEAASCLSRMEARFGPHPELESRRALLGRAAAEAAERAAPREADEVEEAAEAPVEEAVEVSIPAVEVPAVEEAAAPGPEPLIVEEAPAAAGAAAGPAPAAAGGAGDFFDLASELDTSLFSATDATEEETVLTGIEASPEGHSLDEIVSAFKKGIEQQVDKEDFETHYNLGIAYKEMGLTEEAIAEFQFASKDARLMPDCCSMLGLLFREKGMHSLAVKWYRRGMDALATAADEERLNGLRFDLAEVLEQMGEYRQALDLFVEVYGVDSRYRDVGARIKSLESRLAG